MTAGSQLVAGRSAVCERGDVRDRGLGDRLERFCGEERLMAGDEHVGEREPGYFTPLRVKSFLFSPIMVLTNFTLLTVP